MPSRRQHMKSSTSFTPEESIMIEIFETQSQTKIQISIENAFDKEFSSNMTSAIGTRNFVAIFENVSITDTSLEINENLTADQIKKKLLVIEIEGRRTYLRIRLIQVEAEREIDFSIAVAHQFVSKFSRKDNKLQTALSLKKELKFKTSN